jgi:hypothetical protein
MFNPLNAELNPTCYLLALLGAHPILHISRIRVKISNPTTQKMYCISVTKNKMSTFKEIIAVCYEDRLKHTGT